MNAADDVQDESSEGETTRATAAGQSAMKPMEAGAKASSQLAQLTGKAADGIVGLQATEDGWLVTLETVEVARIPPSTDLIGVYEVHLDHDGDVRGYERVRRHVRGQAGDDQL